MRYLKRIGLCLVVVLSVLTGRLLGERQVLGEKLIRFHVVANSDSSSDQAVKLQVRDAVIQSLQQDLQGISDVSQAKAYLQENLPRIQATANAVLEAAGVEPDAVVTLCREAFDTRYYDTFSLPAGIYESLRIVIGQGRGHNWWCVAFPALCAPVTKEGFEAAAVGAGFSEEITETLAEGEYEIRFFLLDQLGKLENIFFPG